MTGASSGDRIEGRNPVREALRAGRPLRRILVAEGAPPRGSLAEIISLARSARVRVDRVPRAAIDRLAASRAHQGVIAEAEAFLYRTLDDALAVARQRGEAPLLLALDGITDPGNVGSLIRSAEAAGCHGVIIAARRAAAVTPVVEKAAAGALSHIAVIRAANLQATLEECRRIGVWVVGLSNAAETTIWDCELWTESVVIVVGAEGKGLGRLVSERADMLVAIPMSGLLDSLNAAVSGAVSLFEVRRRRGPRSWDRT